MVTCDQAEVCDILEDIYCFANTCSLFYYSNLYNIWEWVLGGEVFLFKFIGQNHRRRSIGDILFHWADVHPRYGIGLCYCLLQAREFGDWSQINS